VLGKDVVLPILDGWRTEPMDEGQRATLELLAKVTLDHESLGPQDVDEVRAAGVSDEAIVDALHVAFAFNVITRMADTLGWHVPDDVSFQASAKFLLKFGYK
jgi:alkylhydroperoxidase family enzyme